MAEQDQRKRGRLDKQKAKFIRTIRQLVFGLVPPYALHMVGSAVREKHLKDKLFNIRGWVPPYVLRVIGTLLQREKLFKPWYFTNCCLTGENIEIGDYTYGIPKILSYGDGTSLKIGKFCSISAEVTIFLGGDHRIDWVTTYPFVAFGNEWHEARGTGGHPSSKGGITIGNDVWIGYGAMIMSGVKIGDGATIGAGSVVTTDVEPYSIVGGVPAHLIKKRFDDETIHALLEIRWWDWPPERIKDNLGILMSGNISGILSSFIRNANNQPPA